LFKGHYVDYSYAKANSLAFLTVSKGGLRRNQNQCVYWLPMFFRLLLLFALFLPLGLSQDETVGKLLDKKEKAQSKDEHTPPPWYEQVTGILGIPVALLTPVLAFVVLKKSRLESRRTELEIMEKEKELGLGAGTERPPQSVISPTIPYVVSSIILRYILLELTLRLMTLLTTPLEYAFKGIGFGIYALLESKFRNNTPLEMTLYGVAQLGTVAASILLWTVLIILGWPLFKDVLKFFNISLREFGFAQLWSFVREWRTLEKQVNSLEQK
jgi:hypothetical protein